MFKTPLLNRVFSEILAFLSPASGRCSTHFSAIENAFFLSDPGKFNEWVIFQV
jgi:hypothetical protein